MVFWPPKGVHIWRQTDTLSIAFMIYKKWASLWHPQPLRIGPHDIPELPWLSYFLSLIWNVTDYQEWFYRLSSCVLWFGALLFFFSFTFRRTHSFFKSVVFTLFLFASPLISYYGCNYLPDVPALALTIIGLSCIFHRVEGSSRIWTIIGSIAFLGAVLLKASHMLGICALGGSLVLLWIKEKKRFQYIDVLIGLMISGFLGMLWYKLSPIGSTGFGKFNYLPLWKWEHPQKTLNTILFFWSRFYGGVILLLTYGTCILFALFQIAKRKEISLLSLTFVLYFIGSVLYFLFFFGAFQDHDYYVIVLLGIIPLVLWWLANNIPSLGVIFLLAVSLYGIYHAREMNQERFSIWAHENLPAPFYESNFRKKVRSVIPEEAIVLVPEDITPNKWLYFLRRRGFSGFDLGLTEYGQSPDSTRLAQILHKNVTHIVLTSKSNINLYLPYIHPKPLLEDQGILVYKVKVNEK